MIASDPRGFQVKKIKKPPVIHISICCFFFGLFLSLQQISGEGENGQIRSLEEREKQSKKKKTKIVTDRDYLSTNLDPYFR